MRAWPTLVVVHPEGYVVAQLSGEGHAHALDRLLAGLVTEHDAKGTLHRGDGPYVAPLPPDTDLRFPGKAVRLPSGTLLVSDIAATAASCDHPAADGGSEFPACHVHQQDWGVPVRLVEGAQAGLTLHLAG